MNKVICTTTINPPTEALLKFAQMDDWKLVVAGDTKTVGVNYKKLGGNVIYLSPDVQEAIDHHLSDLIGWCCIQRRNFAFLYAYKELKADIIATVDDDNIPLQNWGVDIRVGTSGRYNEYNMDLPAFDPLFVTAYKHLWHRGFPIELVKQRVLSETGRATIVPHIQANLWDGEPDIDAICRLTKSYPECVFEERPFFAGGQPSPFNSQNTLLTREVMPHYFMFPHIGRMDDIWASYHVQAQGFRVVYGPATVVQKRNPHNPVTDLFNELEGVRHNLDIVMAVESKNKNAVLQFLPNRSLLAFHKYQTHFT